MKKSLQNIIRNQNGSLFVYLYFLLTLLLILIFSLFTRLQTEQRLAVLEVEHLQLEMIHQQTYQTLINNWDLIDQEITPLLSFHNGVGRVIIDDQDDDFYQVRIIAIREPSHRRTKTYYLEKNQFD